MADDLAKLADDLEAFARSLQNQRLLSRIGLAAERLIKDRTRRGVDFEERVFERAPTAEAGSPYSPGHAQKRADQGLPTGLINLQFTLYGGSMEAFDHVVARDLQSVALRFTSARAERIMRFHNIEGAGKSKVIRKNIGLSRRDLDRIKDLVEDHVGDQIKLFDFN